MQFLFKILLLCLLFANFKQFAAVESSEENFKNMETTIEDVIDPADDAIEATDISETGTDEARRGRQFFFQPSWVVTQNFGFPAASTCSTVNGVPGRCVLQGSCTNLGELNNRHKRQLVIITPLISKQINEGFCLLYDQFGFGHQGICCPAINEVPVQTDFEETPVQNATNIDTTETNHLGDSDSETVVSSTTELNQAAQPMLPTDLNFAVGANWPFGDVRYQWPFQFGMQFGGVDGVQWAPAIPSYPTSIANWPPPIPTHPPNHHYPTHPPGSTAFTTSTRPATTQTSTTTTTTSRRPTYPTYTTTQRPTSVSNDVSQTGTSANGLPLQCGKKNPPSADQQRIVGGNNASPYEFPWVVVLFKSGKQFCGGSLITKNHILSAAHCVARMTPWDVAALTAHLGDYNIRTDFEVKHVARRIKRLVRHKGFDFSTLHNDISILTLSEPVQFSKEIQPICLPTANSQLTRSYSGYVATVVGWGSLRENGPQPSILQKVDIPVWTNSECARKYGSAAPAGIISSMLCAGQVARDSCSGDSGGPLIIIENGRYTQVGIVSWGIGCGKGEYPGVYTRVTSLLPWIYKNIV